MDYLKLPLDFSSILNGKPLARCSVEESIAQNIMLLITSHNEEIIGKESFGSKIWDLEFNQLVKISEWEEQVRESLVQSITAHEKRLKDIEVEVLLSEIDDDFHHNRNSHIRRKAQISVHGKIRSNDIPFRFRTLLYISPLSQ